MYSPIIQEYKPSLALGIIGIVLITLFACYHILLYFRLKTWFFYLMILCSILEIIGFTARLVWITTERTLLLYVSYVMIMISPSLLAAACHMTFGRILSFAVSPLYQDTNVFILPVGAIAPLFVSLDLVTFCFHLLGGTLICAAYIIDPTPIPEDTHVLGAGLQVLKWSTIMQIVCLAMFAVCALRFFTLKKCWQTHFKGKTVIVFALASAVWISSTLIMLRAIYQVTQVDAAIADRETFTCKHEWVFWIIDALPIFFIFLSFGVVHPGRCLPHWVTSLSLAKSANTGILQYGSEWDHQHQAMLSRPMQDQSLAYLPSMISIEPPTKSRSSPYLKVFGTDSCASTPTSTRGYHEISPYESPKSYRAFMHGAL